MNISDLRIDQTGESNLKKKVAGGGAGRGDLLCSGMTSKYARIPDSLRI